MKKYLHILSLVPAKISIDNNETFLQKVDVIAEKNIYITFYPLSEKYLPAVCSLNDPFPVSINKIPFSNNHYEIIFDPIENIDKNAITTLNKKYNDTIFKSVNSYKTFICISNKKISHNSVLPLINNIQFKTYDEIAIVQGTTYNAKTYILIFDTKKSKLILENCFDQFESNGTLYKALKKEKTFYNYGLIYEYNCQNKKLDKHTVITKENTQCDLPELIPQIFLESIKYEDYATTKQLLDNNTISIEQIKSYFGEIKEVYFNKYSKDINYTIKTDTYKNYTFTVANNKILDIEENKIIE